MEMVFGSIAIILISLGLLFFLGTAVGVMRFPDFYTRMHAAGKGDTLSTILLLAGMAVYAIYYISAGEHFHAADLLVVLKILGIAVFIMLTGPTSTHALMEAGYDDAIKPVTKGDRNKSADDGAGEKMKPRKEDAG